MGMMSYPFAPNEPELKDRRPTVNGSGSRLSSQRLGYARPQRWAAAVEAQVDLQDEYRVWRDDLPASLESSRLAGKLQAIGELDLDELQSIDPLRGSAPATTVQCFIYGFPSSSSNSRSPAAMAVMPLSGAPSRRAAADPR